MIWNFHFPNTVSCHHTNTKWWHYDIQESNIYTLNSSIVTEPYKRNYWIDLNVWGKKKIWEISTSSSGKAAALTKRSCLRRRAREGEARVGCGSTRRHRCQWSCHGFQYNFSEMYQMEAAKMRWLKWIYRPKCFFFLFLSFLFHFKNLTVLKRLNIHRFDFEIYRFDFWLSIYRYVRLL